MDGVFQARHGLQNRASGVLLCVFVFKKNVAFFVVFVVKNAMLPRESLRVGWRVKLFI